MARVQHDRRSGLLLDGQAIRWPVVAANADAGPDWAPRRPAEPLPGAPQVVAAGGRLGPGAGEAGAGAVGDLNGVDLLPTQDGEELTLRADSLAAQPVLRLVVEHGPGRWLPIGLGLAALALVGLAFLRRR